MATFRWVWIATIVSNIGGWFQEVAAGWLMTSLSPSPLMVSLVQAATTLPLLLFGLPAGALADILDRRKLLLTMTLWMTAAAAILAVLQLTGTLGAIGLLALVFTAALGTALTAPAWQAIVPELVPRSHLSPAIALNSVGINIARAIGPAAAGVIIAQSGPGIAFAVNALSFLGVAFVIWRWRRVPTRSKLPAEHFLSAMAVGLRYVRHAPRFRAVLVRSFAFAFSAVSLWALLPIATRELLGADASGYGILLACIGVGAVISALVLPALRRRLGPEALTALATLAYAAAVLALARAPAFPVACGLMAVAGMGWIAMLSTVHVSAQILLPGWVRARGLSVSLTVFFGSMALGSVVWGVLAQHIGLVEALVASSAALTLGAFTSLVFRLPRGDGPNLAPSKHWPQPDVVEEPDNDRGPVMILVEYDIAPADADAFEQAARRLRAARLRNGALSWAMYRDASSESRYVEAFLDRSWLDHLRRHERVSADDRIIETELRAYHRGPEPPRVQHLIAGVGIGR